MLNKHFEWKHWKIHAYKYYKKIIFTYLIIYNIQESHSIYFPTFEPTDFDEVYSQLYSDSNIYWSSCWKAKITFKIILLIFYIKNLFLFFLCLILIILIFHKVL